MEALKEEMEGIVAVVGGASGTSVSSFGGGGGNGDGNGTPVSTQKAGGGGGGGGFGSGGAVGDRINSSNEPQGGGGGFGGGGANGVNGGNAGGGGFGGGGGDSTGGGTSQGGRFSGKGKGGGAGLGGAIFVGDTATCIIKDNVSISGNSVLGGSGANPGQGYAPDIFLFREAKVVFDNQQPLNAPLASWLIKWHLPGT